MPQMPLGSALHVNVPLTQISVAWQNGPEAQNYIADQVFPVIPVRHQGNLYWKYRRQDWIRGQAEKRAPATESAGSGWEMEQDSYFADVWAFHKDLDDQTRANADSIFNLERESAIFVTNNLLLKRENEWTSTFLTTGVWTGATGIYTGADGADLTGGAATGANQFVQFDRSGSDPILEVNRQIVGMARKTGYRPNVLIMGPLVWDALTRNAAILERIKYTGGGGWITEDVMAKAFNVRRILVTWGIQNTANFGEAEDTDFLNGKDMLLAYAAPRPGLRTPSAGYIFAWSGLLGDGAYSTRIKSFRMEQIASDRIEGEMAFDMKVVAPELGVFFNDAVQ